VLLGEHQRLQAKSFAVELRIDGTLDKGKFCVQAVWDSSSEKTDFRPRNQRSSSVEAEEDEMTLLRQSGQSEAKTFDFRKPVITIGRGSSAIKVDLPLQDDKEVSRRHASLEFKEGNFKLTCEGSNPILIDGAKLLQGASAHVKPGQRIEICSFTLQIELPAAK